MNDRDEDGRLGHRRGEEELGRLLRRGDPADDGRAPSAEEFAALRRRVLAESRGDGKARSTAGPWLAPAAALAAAAIFLLFALGLLETWNPVRTARPGGEVAEVPTATPESIVEEDPSRTAGDAPGSPGAITPTPPLPEPPAAASAETEAGAPAKAAVAAGPEPAIPGDGPIAEKESRTVHFTTPGGTRVVWILEPGLELNLDRPPRAGQGVDP